MATPVTGSLDREVALSRLGGDSALLKEIGDLFLDHYQDWIRELRDAAARGDAQQVERMAHNLKGSVANFGARNAVEASLDLEKLGKSCDLAGVAASLAALETALETLRQELESL
jgi:HPt (histidine-containing phosphotransfer) domain-containing protein